jgi:four helix bundle protein
VKAKLQDPSTKLQRSSQNGSQLEYTQLEPMVLSVGESSGGDQSRHPFDLEERTAVFGEAIVRFVKKVPRGPDNDRLIDQLVGCGTSIGANYCEANEGVSKKDFHCIIGRCRKEAKETKFFLRMIAAAEPPLASEARRLFREARELHLIFCTIFRNSG